MEVRQTELFARWLTRLKDARAKGVIVERLRRLELGHRGDVKAIAGGVFEMRIHMGPGYRIYAIDQHSRTVVLLCGGAKGSQRRDIERAISLAQELDP